MKRFLTFVSIIGLLGFAACDNVAPPKEGGQGQAQQENTVPAPPTQ